MHVTQVEQGTEAHQEARVGGGGRGLLMFHMSGGFPVKTSLTHSGENAFSYCDRTNVLSRHGNQRSV